MRIDEKQLTTCPKARMLGLKVLHIPVYVNLLFSIIVPIDSQTVTYMPKDQRPKLGSQNLDWNCSLVPEFTEQRDHIATLANDGSKLVKVTVQIRGRANDSFPDTVYNPRNWVITTSITGKSMLMLKEYFDAMSLTTLGYGVSKTSITLQQFPEDCLKGADNAAIENKLREHFLINFHAEENTLPEGTEICNTHVMQVRKYEGKVGYVCCTHTLKGELFCSELKESIWLKILFVLILILQAIIILYSPLLLPSGLYKAKTIFEKFTFETQQEEIVKFNVKAIREGTAVDQHFVEGILQTFTNFNSLQEHLGEMIEGRVYTMYTDKIDIRVRMSKLVASGSSPVTFISFLRSFFVRCKIREEVSSLSECCNANMFEKIPRACTLPWHKCLQFVMYLIVLGLLTLPWSLRVIFYYSVEQEPIQHMRQALKEKNMSALYSGNLLSNLSPIHPLFLIIYSIIGLQVMIYLLMPDIVKRKIKYIVRKCLRDMRDVNRTTFFCVILSKLLLPFARFGVLGCCLLPICLIILPFSLILLIFNACPLLNFLFRLLVNLIYRILKTCKPDNTISLNTDERQTRGKIMTFFEHNLSSVLVTEQMNDTEERKRWYQILYAVCIIFNLASMLVILILVFECVSFYVECAVYTLVGLILNPKDTLKYISLLLLIAVYGNECFSSAYSTYSSFSKGINGEIQGLIGQIMQEEAAKPDHEQENAAFRIPARQIGQERLRFVLGSEKYLKVNIPRLAMFLDRSDIPYIPKIFLFQLAKLEHQLCPGPVHLLYLKALRDFSIILVFLFFVFVVIFAFGQAQDISSGAQAIAALGSGFLPLVLKRFLFQSQGGPGFDNSNLKWKNLFSNKVQTLATRWNFQDINISQKHEVNVDDEANNDLDNDLKQRSPVDLIVLKRRDGTFSYFVPVQERNVFDADAAEQESFVCHVLRNMFG